MHNPVITDSVLHESRSHLNLELWLCISEQGWENML